MRRFGSWMTAAFMAGVLCHAAAAQNEVPPPPPPPPQKADAAVVTTTVTATVAKIDQKTREVTLRAEDGKEYTFVAGDHVKNLAQVKQGDVVTANYTEALAYEVKKGGTTGTGTTAATAGAPLGSMPAGVVARQTTVTVKITAIDPKVPSVTFVGPAGNTRTIKVRYPERLQGVSIGDTVEITYAEALAMKVEKAPAK